MRSTFHALFLKSLIFLIWVVARPSRGVWWRFFCLFCLIGYLEQPPNIMVTRKPNWSFRDFKVRDRLCKGKVLAPRGEHFWFGLVLGLNKQPNWIYFFSIFWTELNRKPVRTDHIRFGSGFFPSKPISTENYFWFFSLIKFFQGFYFRFISNFTDPVLSMLIF